MYIKNKFNVKLFMFEFIYLCKSELNNKFEAEKHIYKQKFQMSAWN